MTTKIIIIVLAVFLLMSLSASFSWAEAPYDDPVVYKEKPVVDSVPQESPSESQAQSRLEFCSDMKLGVSFLCNLDWEAQTVDNTVMLILSKEPDVTLTITRSESKVVFLEQLTDQNLKEIAGYADGFQKEKILVNNREMIKVEGFSKEIADMRLEDYYFIDGLTLYGFLFAVTPPGQYSGYQELIQQIIQSVQLIKN